MLAVAKSPFLVFWFGCLSYRLLHKTASWYDVVFPRLSNQRDRDRETDRYWEREREKMEDQVFLWSKLGVTFHHFCYILLVLSKLQSPAHIQGHVRHKYRRGILGSHLIGYLPQYYPLFSNSVQHNENAQTLSPIV